MLGQLLQALDEASVAPAEDDLGELFREFRPEALATLLDLAARSCVEPRIKGLLEGAADHLAAEQPAGGGAAAARRRTRRA